MNTRLVVISSKRNLLRSLLLALVVISSNANPSLSTPTALKPKSSSNSQHLSGPTSSNTSKSEQLTFDSKSGLPDTSDRRKVSKVFAARPNSGLTKLAQSAPPPDALLLGPDQDFDEGQPIFDKNTILLKAPELKALVTIDEQMSPFGLDSNASQAIDLRKTLQTTIDNSLDLAISRTSSDTSRWQYYNSLTKFAPDLMLGYQEYFAKGNIGLPFNPGTFVPGAAVATSALPSGDIVARVKTPFVISRAGFNWNLFRGGRTYFGASESKHNWKASKAGLQSTLSNVLLTSTQEFYNLLLNEALLQIRIKAVQTSEEQLRVNKDRFELGLATNLDVLQATTQLSRDRQALIDQQIARRTAAIRLSDTMNVNLGTDLVPAERVVRKVRLVNPKLVAGDLLKLAIDNRPELKQYEELRIAAKKAIIVAGGSLLPSFAFGASVYGIGPGIAKQEALFALNLNLKWELAGFGTADYTNVRTAKFQARQAQLQAQKELVTVLDQVRTSYLNSLDADRKIDETSTEVDSALEELRLARLRFSHGLGTNLDIITGQRDYTQALIDKAQAIINFNNAQAQLVHDMGLSSVDAFTSGRLLGG